MVSLRHRPQQSPKLCPSLDSSDQVILPPSGASLGQPSPHPPASPLQGLGAVLLDALDLLGAPSEWPHEPRDL